MSEIEDLKKELQALKDQLNPPPRQPAFHGLAFHFIHDICTTEVLAAQRFFRCANLLLLHSFSFLVVAIVRLRQDCGTVYGRRRLSLDDPRRIDWPCG